MAAGVPFRTSLLSDIRGDAGRWPELISGFGWGWGAASFRGVILLVL